MKKIYYLLFTSIFAGVTINAQPCLSSATLCNYNLNNPIFSEAQIHIPPSTEYTVYGKSGTTFKDVKYIEEDCGTSNSCDTNYNTILKYNAYYPKSTSYNYAECGGLPFIIFVHGGAYSDCSSFEIDNTNGFGTMLIELARRGFVVFNVNYRTGRLLDLISPTSQQFTSVQEQLAGYRAGQDVRGAIRSILKHQQNGTFDDL